MSDTSTTGTTDWEAKAREIESATAPHPVEAPPVEVVVPIERPPARGSRGTPKETLRPATKFAWRKPTFFRGHLDQMIPTAERCKIEKRGPDGKLHYVGAYRPQELDRSLDIEDFIKTYVVPTYGVGEYDVSVVDAAGNTSRAMTVVIAEPLPAAASAPSATSLNDALLGRLLDRLDRLESEAAKPPPDSLDMLKKAEEVKRALGLGDKTDPATLLMLLRQMDGGGDAARRAAEIAEIRAAVNALRAQASAPAPIPIPPPPPAEPSVDIVQLITKTAELARPQGPSVVELISLLDKHNPKESFTIKDFLTLLPTVMGIVDKFTEPTKNMMAAMMETLEEMREERQNRKELTLREKLEEMKLMKELATGFFGKDGPESFAGFLTKAWSTLPDNLDAIANLVDKIKKEGEDEHPAKKRTSPQRGLPARGDSEDVPPPARAEDRLAEAAEPEKRKRRPQVEFPDNFEAMLAKIAAVKGDGAEAEAERIRAAVEAMIALFQCRGWAEWGPRIQDLAKQKKHEDLLDIVRELFGGLTARFRAVLPSEAKDATVAAFERHIDKVAEAIANYKKKA